MSRLKCGRERQSLRRLSTRSLLNRNLSIPVTEIDSHQPGPLLNALLAEHKVLDRAQSWLFDHRP